METKMNLDRMMTYEIQFNARCNDNKLGPFVE